MRRSLSPITIAAVPVLLALIGNLATSTVTIPDRGKPWICAATAVLALATIINEVRRQGAAGNPPPPDGDDLDEAANRLAHAIDHQWRREERHRKVADPIALPVRWHPAADHLVDHWTNIRHIPIGSTADPIPLTGHLDQITEIYQRIPSHRLVILGQGGSGKTILASRLALGLLATRTPGDRVPVLVSLSAWNPHTPLRDWLVDQLIRDHPGLAATGSGQATMAAALLNADRILPILDGFDEINKGLHRAAIEHLNTIADLPLVLTSRPQEYATAVQEADVLTNAAGIELDDLTLDDLDDYLPRTTRRRSTDAHTGIWQPVLGRLRTHPHEPSSVALRQTLTTPLMVYLARTIYSDIPDHDPADLLDDHRFPTQETLEEHLLAEYIPSVYRYPTNGRSWNPDHARRWLAYLARHLDQLDTRDLAWWQLRDTIPRTTRVAAFGLTGGLMFGLPSELMFGLPGWLMLGLPGWLPGGTVGLTSGLMLGLAVGLPAVGPSPARTSLQIRGNLRRLTAGLMFGLIGGLMFGLTSGLTVGLTFGLTSGLETIIDMTTAVSAQESLTTDRNNTIRKVAVFGLAFGFTFGLVGGLAFGLTFGLTFGLVGGLFGLTVGLMFGLTNAWSAWLILARTWLPLTGRLPWPVLAFLTDAYNRGVLRQTGAVYQFRHVRLQKHLAQSPTTQPTRPEPTVANQPPSTPQSAGSP